MEPNGINDRIYTDVSNNIYWRLGVKGLKDTSVRTEMSMLRSEGVNLRWYWYTMSCTREDHL
jgi:hypothetical protein